MIGLSKFELFLLALFLVWLIASYIRRRSRKKTSGRNSGTWRKRQRKRDERDYNTKYYGDRHAPRGPYTGSGNYGPSGD